MRRGVVGAGRAAVCLTAGWLTLSAGCRDVQLGVGPANKGLGGSAQRDVVSRVNDSVITATEVDRLVRASELAPRAALSRLQAERLLSQEAHQRGYAQRSRTQHVTRQSLVQALLARDVETEQPSAEAVESAYGTQRARFEQAEQRRATHVLAGLRPDAGLSEERAARAFIEQAIALLSRSQDRKATLEALRSESAQGFELAVQDLPLARAEGMFVPEFSKALFSLPEVGVVPEPVRTQFGYHAIVVTEIVPARSTPRSEALEQLQAELGTHLHEKRVTALLSELRQRTPVSYAPAVESLLASLQLGGE